MSKYFLFAYDGYYPSGGAEDCKGIFDTERTALDYLRNHSRIMDYDYVELCDIKKNEFNLIYDGFEVVDGEGCLCRVFGDRDAKVIKAICASRRKIPRAKYYVPRFDSMGDYSLDGAIELPKPTQ